MLMPNQFGFNFSIDSERASAIDANVRDGFSDICRILVGTVDVAGPEGFITFLVPNPAFEAVPFATESRGSSSPKSNFSQITFLV
jgi:hypothetical protein